MTTIGTPLLPTDETLDLLYQSIKHTHSTELQSTAECHICHEPFLSGNHPERRVTLPCSHIFGEGCILKWVSLLLENAGQNSCPMCREPILELRAQEPLTTHTMYNGPTLSADLFRLLYTLGMADLAYSFLCWLKETSIFMPKMVVIFVLFVGLFLLPCVDEYLTTRYAATVGASRRLMTAVAARDWKGFKASMTAFENGLCEEVPEILLRVWHAGRQIVVDCFGEETLEVLAVIWRARRDYWRILVFYRIYVLALWNVLWVVRLVGMSHDLIQLSMSSAATLYRR